MVSTLLYALSTLIGCQPCPGGFVANEEGGCSWEKNAEEGSSTPLETSPEAENESTTPPDSEPEEDVVLTGDCVPIENEIGDPLIRTGHFFVQDALFAELIDIDGDSDEIWAVGQGGIMIFNGVEGELDLIADISPMGWDHRLHRVVVTETAVYATHRDRGLVVIDRAQKAIVETFPGSDFSGLAVDTMNLYVVAHDGNIHVYDRRDPLNLIHLQTTSAFTNGFTPALAQSYLYIADLEEGLVVLDPNDSLSYIASTPAIGGAQDMALSEDGLAAYLAVGSEGVEIFDLSIPTNPVSLGNIPLNHTALSVDVDGDVLWVVSQQDLIAIDISSSLSPRLINTEQTEQWAMAVTGINGKAYVADWGYLSRFERLSNDLAPDLDLSARALMLNSEEQVNVDLVNLGGETLNIAVAVSDNPSHVVSLERSEIESGGSIRMTVASMGPNPDGVICISSDDPDSPLTYIQVGDDGSALGLGPNSMIGQTAPDFNLIDTNGQLHRLSESRGHPVVLVYFATW